MTAALDRLVAAATAASDHLHEAYSEALDRGCDVATTAACPVEVELEAALSNLEKERTEALGYACQGGPLCCFEPHPVPTDDYHSAVFPIYSAPPATVPLAAVERLARAGARAIWNHPEHKWDWDAALREAGLEGR